MVEGIERLQSELQARAFPEVEVLHHRHIPDLVSGAQQGTGARAAEVPDRISECGSVEELSNGLRATRASALIGANSDGTAAHAQAARI